LYHPFDSQLTASPAIEMSIAGDVVVEGIFWNASRFRIKK
jgi:hypothetical protein